jgi:hypothetical protein
MFRLNSFIFPKDKFLFCCLISLHSMFVVESFSILLSSNLLMPTGSYQLPTSIYSLPTGRNQLSTGFLLWPQAASLARVPTL